MLTRTTRAALHLPIALALTATACSDAPARAIPLPSDLDTAGYTFVAAEPLPAVPDVAVARICAGWDTPDALSDTTNIDCTVEVFDFSGEPAAPVTHLTLLTFNIERGFRLDEQLAWLAAPGAPRPDIVLIQEADRGCSRTQRQHILVEWARALSMHAVFAVEFVELPGDPGPASLAETCEHGNGILSRYPLGNVQAVRHRSNKSWFLPADRRDEGEPRLGGRIAVLADVLVGEQILHIVSVHFESDPDREDVNADQAAEVVELLANKPHQRIVGGDTNAPFYFIDLLSPEQSPIDRTTQAFLSNGYVDAHAPLPFDLRDTADRGLVLDLIFGDAAFFTAPAVCQAAPCDALSDHKPVWVDVLLR